MANLNAEAFELRLAEIRNQLETVAPIAEEKKINYGHQFVLKQSTAKTTLNIYNGKKGLNMVWQGDKALQEKLQQALLGQTAQNSSNSAPREDCLRAEAEMHCPHGAVWAGSDESGKGDFFGPLVVAAVVVDTTTAAKLQAVGVKDCKLLTDKKILELEQAVKAAVVDFSVLELKPKFYNLRYAQVAAQGGKLNQLLTSGHVEALSQVLRRQPQAEGALIDQFTPSNTILQLLKQRFPEVEFRQQPRAESDMAVAAASVLARARFLQTMEALSWTAGMELPKGGGEQTTACAKVLAAKLGKDELVNFVKQHFVNYTKL